MDATRPGGLVSLLTRNRAGIAMRAGMSGDWTGALAGFDARRYENRLGLEDLRADEPGEVEAAFAAAGWEAADRLPTSPICSPPRSRRAGATRTGRWPR